MPRSKIVIERPVRARAGGLEAHVCVYSSVLLTPHRRACAAMPPALRYPQYPAFGRCASTR